MRFHYFQILILLLVVNFLAGFAYAKNTSVSVLDFICDRANEPSPSSTMVDGVIPSVLGITIPNMLDPMFNECKTGSEFDKKKCAKDKPIEMSIAKNAIYYNLFKGKDIVHLLDYNFKEKRFQLDVGHYISNPIKKESDKTVGFLSTAPLIGGKLSAAPLHSFFLSQGDEAEAEALANRFRASKDIAVAMWYKLGQAWTDHSKDNKWIRGKNVAASIQLQGYTMDVIAILVFDVKTEENFALWPYDGPIKKNDELCDQYIKNKSNDFEKKAADLGQSVRKTNNDNVNILNVEAALLDPTGEMSENGVGHDEDLRPLVILATTSNSGSENEVPGRQLEIIVFSHDYLSRQNEKEIVRKIINLENGNVGKKRRFLISINEKWEPCANIRVDVSITGQIKKDKKSVEIIMSCGD